jgi:hypothetical protein
MTGIDSVELQQVIIHKAGNPTRGEELQLSDEILTIEDEMVTKLLTVIFSEHLTKMNCTSSHI